jgi:hypothetical protein
MVVLLVPQAAINVVALKQLVMTADVINHTAVKHKNGIRLHS